MTLYQELQLNQAGSKNLIRSCKDTKEKKKHIAIYCLKVFLTTVFCVGFVAAFTMLFGEKNGVVGVAVLLSLMAFRHVNLGFDTFQSFWTMLGIFVILAVGPYAANRFSMFGAFVVNFTCILPLLVMGCHNVIFFNHATFILSYLLLYGNDVTGADYAKRIVGLMLGGIWVAACIYRKNKECNQKRTLWDVLQEFRMDSTRSQWQIKLALGVSLSMLIGQIIGLPRVMWIGIAAMSLLQPFDSDRKVKMKYRFIGTLAGCLVFFLLIKFLPESSYGLIGIIGGIAVGFCATYKWQTVCNALGALGLAMSLYGADGAIALRIANNGFALVFVLLFAPVFDMAMRQILKSRETAVRDAA